MKVGAGEIHHVVHGDADLNRVSPDDAARDPATRKTLGIYYTPDWVARPMTAWAIADNHGPILDPSFGGCAFLNAALDEFSSLRIANSPQLIYGCDIDRGAARYADHLYRRGVPRDQVRFIDFISTDTMRWLGARFRATVGNPPYVRHHSMSANMIESAQFLITSYGFTLPRRASAWAYFALLSTVCIRDGGRLAMVLPGALLHVDYGEALLSDLSHCFGRVRILQLRERLFRDAEEETVIILASDRGRATRTVDFQRVADRDTLLMAIGNDIDDIRLSSMSQHKFSLLKPAAIDAWHSVRDSVGGVRLGDVARVRIGVVTASNNFFVRGGGDPIFQCSSVAKIPIVRSKTQLTTPTLHAATVYSREWASYLVGIDRTVRSGSPLARELLRGSRAGIPKRHQAQIRAVWYCINDRLVPDAFLPYMSASPSPMIRNRAGALCTNAIHRVSFTERSVIDSVVAGSYSCLYRFEAELFGRHYGGGVLKLEPRAAMTMTAAINLEIGLKAQAGELCGRADAALLRRTSGSAIRELRDAARILEHTRRGLR